MKPEQDLEYNMKDFLQILASRYTEQIHSHFPRSMFSFTSKLYLPYYSTSSEDFCAVWHFTWPIAMVEKINYVFYNYFVYEVIEIHPYLQCLAFLNIIRSFCTKKAFI